MNTLKTNLWMAGLALVTAVSLLLAACGEDDGGGNSDPSGSPGVSASETVRPSVPPLSSPGSGASPFEAVSSYLQDRGIDGIELQGGGATCTAAEIPEGTEATTIAGLGQFCFTVTDIVPFESMTGLLILPGTNDVWEFGLTFSDPTWSVEGVRKASD